LVLMKECGQKKGESSCYLNIGLVYSEQGDQMKAIEYMLKGIKIKTELNDKKGIRIGYNNIGNIYSTMGNYKEGLNYYFKTLKLAEELNDQLAISYAYDNIGTIFYHQNKLDVALIYYKKAVKIQEDTGEKLIKGNSYNSIGNIYQIKKQYKEALEYHVRDLKIKEVANDKQGIATACYHIGLDYYGTKNFEKALSYQRMSFAICNEIGYKKGIAEATGGIGKIYEEKKDYSKALIHYNQMLSISNELSFKEGIRDAYSNLASVSIKLKQFEKALKYVELHNEIKDTLLNKENFKQINELNTRYETDKKEKEILLLTKDKELNAKIIRQQQLVRWGLIGGLGLLSVSVFSIYRRYRFKQKANVILEKQKEEIQQKNMLITDSIDYAQTIQQAVLPTQEDINQLIPHSFILYKPKAVVSGDFYWIGQVKERLVCAVADCTGHGVPGAFMSLLGYNMLENAVKNPMITTPAIILDTLNTEINLRLAGNNRAEESKHGMDISLITINKKTNSLEFAGAHNSIYIVRKNELIELKADKMGIGGNKQTNRTFTNQITEIQTGDMIYLFTDGFPDQIGGPNRKKFYYQPFKELLVSISSLEMKQQQIRLNDAHSKWMGDRMDQTDDILIMGIRYS
ncbi:MAG TPA: tetratricopeptide repeat protein, partial [Bacteroidia bacterium]|nr:tetratricopeptide repeat protein [Bacteroidia bacterium]